MFTMKIKSIFVLNMLKKLTRYDCVISEGENFDLL